MHVVSQVRRVATQIYVQNYFETWDTRGFYTRSTKVEYYDCPLFLLYAARHSHISGSAHVLTNGHDETQELRTDNAYYRSRSRTG